MKLSAPIYRLKRQAKTLARDKGVPLHQALDLIAAEEGFSSWSLLAARAAEASPARELLQHLESGDLMLIGAPRGHGKTLMSLEVAVEAIKAGRDGAFFSLDCSEADVAGLLQSIGQDPATLGERFIFDGSDAINADHIVERLAAAPRGTVAVIDYLQILDQRRENPALMDQVRALKTFAAERGIAILFISQIDRSYDPAKKVLPDLEDVRLPNPLDLTLFDKACFLRDGEVQLDATG
jgi:replicative DNA helicase